MAAVWQPMFEFSGRISFKPFNKFPIILYSIFGLLPFPVFFVIQNSNTRSIEGRE
jgi:hypothetical protein